MIILSWADSNVPVLSEGLYGYGELLDVIQWHYGELLETYPIFSDVPYIFKEGLSSLHI